MNCRLTDTKSIMGEEKQCEKENGEEEEERGQWSNPCDFFISCLGYAVGLGPVFKFGSRITDGLHAGNIWLRSPFKFGSKDY